MPSSIVNALVVDFDGTICPRDVSEEILEAFAPPEWWDVDLEFQRGAIGSRECLIRQAELLVGRREEMQRYALERYPLEPSFGPFVGWANDTGIEVTVASDGLGFYVQPMLSAAGLGNLTVLTNDVTLDGSPPRFAFPNGHPICVGCGTCKMLAVVERRSSGFVGFIGEGHSDRYGALYADVVFAKKHLVEICKRDGVPFVPWETFDDVRRSLEEGRGISSRPISPAQCPGWTLPG